MSSLPLEDTFAQQLTRLISSVGRRNLFVDFPPTCFSLVRAVEGATVRTLRFPRHSLTGRASQKNEGDAAPLGEIEHLLIVAGNSDEENPYRKGSAVQVSLKPFLKPTRR